MEDIFQILIWLFIIFSFFSSFFKKKQSPPPQESKNTEVREKAETAYQNKEEEYDILKEIEGLFKQDIPTVEKPSPADISAKKVEEKIEPADKYVTEHYQDDWHRKTQSEHQRTASETSFTDWNKKLTEIEKRKKAVDSKVHAQAKKFEALLDKKEEKTDSLTKKRIIKGLKNQQTLQEYILFSEIIGRPKSLRR